MKRGLVGGISLALAAAWVRADSATVDEVALHWAIRASLARGVAYLSAASGNDPDGWVVPPIRQRRVVGITNVVVRYSERKAPLYAYETYTAYERVRDPNAETGSAKTLRPVQRQRIKGVIDPQGRTILVPDKDGPISRQEQRPVFDKGGLDHWRYGRLGQNGMALHALYRCGLAEDHPTVQRLGRNLLDFVDTFGLPDNTWDLAWLAAAFARMPGEEGKQAALQAASKLLDGQILDGEARGLWGPVSIHVPLLASAYLREQDLSDRLQKAKLALKERETTARTKEVERVEIELRTFQKEMRRIAMLALAFDQIDTPAVRVTIDESTAILMGGTVDYIYNQTSADLDSTTVALYALREAAAQGRLPEKTWRPPLEGIRSAPPPEASEAVLARTVHALARLQQPDGGWTELNLHQPVTSFDRMAKMIPGLPADARSFKALPSPVTPLSRVQGLASLLYAGEAVGMPKVLARFRPQFAKGLTSALAALAEPPAPVRKKAAHPYELDLHAMPAFRPPGALRQDQRPLWLSKALGLTALQNPDGSWRTGSRTHWLPSSFQKRVETLDRRDPKDPTKILNRSVAHVRANWGGDHLAWMNSPDLPVLATAYAMITLCDFARPPCVAVRWGNPAQEVPLAEATLQALSTALGSPWTYVEQTFPLDVLRVEAAPLVFIEGRGPFTADPATRTAIAGVAEAGGLLVAHAANDAEGGLFLKSFGEEIQRTVKGATARDVTAEDRMLGDFAGRLGRPLPAILRADGSPVAVLVATSATGGADGSYSVPQAARIVERLAQRTLDSALLTPDYPCNVGALGDPGALYDTAMRYLRGQVRRDLAEPDTPAADEPAASLEATPEAVATPSEPEAPAVRPPAADEVL